MGRLFRWLPRRLQPLTTNMLLRDEPDHRRLRSLVDQAFLTRSVEALRPRLEALANESLDRLEVRACFSGKAPQALVAQSDGARLYLASMRLGGRLLETAGDNAEQATNQASDTVTN